MSTNWFLKNVKNYNVSRTNNGRPNVICTIQTEDEVSCEDDIVEIPNEEILNKVDDKYLINVGLFKPTNKEIELFNEGYNNSSPIKILDTIINYDHMIIYPSFVELKMCNISDNCEYIESDFVLVTGELDIMRCKEENDTQIIYHNDILDKYNPFKKFMYMETIYVNKNTKKVEKITILDTLIDAIDDEEEYEDESKISIYSFEYNQNNLLVKSSFEYCDFDRETDPYDFVTNRFEYDWNSRLSSVKIVPFFNIHRMDNNIGEYLDECTTRDEVHELMLGSFNKAIKYQLEYSDNKLYRIHEIGSYYFTRESYTNRPDQIVYYEDKCRRKDNYVYVLEYRKYGFRDYISRIQTGYQWDLCVVNNVK